MQYINILRTSSGTLIMTWEFDLQDMQISALIYIVFSIINKLEK